MILIKVDDAHTKSFGPRQIKIEPGAERKAEAEADGEEEIDALKLSLVPDY